MINPFLKQLSQAANRRIRMRLRCIALSRWIVDRKRAFALGVGAPLALAAVIFMVYFAPNYSVLLNTDSVTARIESNVRAAQALEVYKTETGIYHLTRIIHEGYDKPAYVALSTGEIMEAPRRIDTVETWQHNETSLALIESTAHTHAFQAFLARPHNGDIAVHFYGDPRDTPLPPSRTQYDQAHDLASLYMQYQTTERPSIPIIPDDAELISVSPIIFAYAPVDSLVIHAEVDPDTFLITRETIYATAGSGQFEMTVIEYRDRALLPADAFEEIFTPEHYPFERISLAQ